jgi:hypothetical protein
MITSTGKILNSATTDKYYTMLLKVMSLAGDVAGNLDTV